MPTETIMTSPPSRKAVNGYESRNETNDHERISICVVHFLHSQSGLC